VSGQKDTTPATILLAYGLILLTGATVGCCFGGVALCLGLDRWLLVAIAAGFGLGVVGLGVLSAFWPRITSRRRDG